MKKAFVILSVAGMFISSLSAKPLDLSKISKDANWLMHMDFDAMRNSDVGVFMRDKMEKIPEALDRMEKMKETYGVDVDGFSYLTMSGTGERHKGIAIMKGGLDPDVVIDFAESREELRLLESESKGYIPAQGRHPMAFAALKKGVFVGGPDSDYVSEGIMLSKGKADSYEGHPILDVLTDSIEDPGFVVFADIQGAIKNNEIESKMMPMLQKVKAGGMAIGDENGIIRIIAVLETTSEETCKQVEAMINGGMAMLEMRKAQDKRLDRFMQGHSIERDGKMIWIEMKLSSEALMDHLEKEMRKAA